MILREDQKIMLSEKAKSRAQQRFFGMVRSAQKGEMKNPSSEVTQTASSMSKSDVKKMASTKHKGLPERKDIQERLGGKGYKSYTSLTGKKVSGDWEDSDRGAGNKATRRAGGDVKAKSPTYQAHVINKGKKKVDPKKNPVVEAKVDIGKSPEEKEAVRNKRKFGTSHNQASTGALRRSLHKLKRGDKIVKGEKNDWREEIQLNDEMVQELFGLGNKKHPYGKATKENPRGKRDQAELDRAQSYLKKNPNFGKKKKDKDRTDRGDQKEYERAQAYIKKNPNFGKKDVKEAKVEAGRSDYGKASVRNKRKFGKEGEPAVFDASNERGKMIDQRRAEHKAKRGVKEGVMDVVKRYRDKNDEKKPQKAQDAGAKARRSLQRKEYAAKVSGSTENVPDNLRDHKTWNEFKKHI